MVLCLARRGSELHHLRPNKPQLLWIKSHRYLLHQVKPSADPVVLVQRELNTRQLQLVWNEVRRGGHGAVSVAWIVRMRARSKSETMGGDGISSARPSVLVLGWRSGCVPHRVLYSAQVNVIFRRFTRACIAERCLRRLKLIAACD